MTTILIVARYHKTDLEFLAQVGVDKAPLPLKWFKIIVRCFAIVCYIVQL